MSERAEYLFGEALTLPKEARSAYIMAACADDLRLQAELLSLLDHAEPGAEFFERLAPCSLAALPPATIRAGRFTIKDCIGAGGMGAVYRAHDERLGRDVALKFLPSQLGPAPDDGRLLIEARAVAAVEHPNICTVHEIGETDTGHPFIAMALYDGETLKQRLKRGPLSVADALDFAMQVARGLGAAHAHGIVHRDVKPGNIMITARRTVKLLDFGLATSPAAGSAGRATPGTLPYMSPEQIRGDAVGPTSDLWSLGVVLYEMLTGLRPFRGEDDAALMNAIVHAAPKPLRGAAPKVSRSLQSSIARLLEKDPSNRYQNADALLADLAQQSATRSLNRRRMASALGTLAIAIAGLAAWLSAGTPVSEPINWEAHDLYLKGRYFWNQRTPSAYARAIDYFERAIEVDSMYAPAYAGLAAAYSQQGMAAQLTAKEARARARAAALRALALDDNLAEAHAALGADLHAYDWNAQAAERELVRAIELDPNLAMARHYYGNLLRSLGRLDEAVVQNAKAAELDPLVPAFSETLAFTLLRAGRPAEALEQIRNALELDSTYWRAHAVLGNIHEFTHRYDEAMRAYDRANRLVGARRMTADRARLLAVTGHTRAARALVDTLRAFAQDGSYEPALATALYALGDIAAAIDWLEQGFQQRQPHLRFVAGDSRFLPLEREPQFVDLMRRVGVRSSEGTVARPGLVNAQRGAGRSQVRHDIGRGR